MCINAILRNNQYVGVEALKKFDGDKIIDLEHSDDVNEILKRIPLKISSIKKLFEKSKREGRQNIFFFVVYNQKLAENHEITEIMQ